MNRKSDIERSEVVPVILCGGSGSRLWPISREYFPKQFHKLLDKDLTLFQSTVQRAVGATGARRIVALTKDDHRFVVSEQIADLESIEGRLILEPCARNTAPAIAIAAMDCQETYGDALMVILPSDHVIKNQQKFTSSIRTAIKAASMGNLATIGVVPSHAETGYGYIKAQQAGQNSDYLPIERFIEKPDEKLAEQLVDQGCYWNSGIFIFSASVFLDELKRHEPVLYQSCVSAWDGRSIDYEYQKIGQEFSLCESISVDYAVMEKTHKGVVVPHLGDWSDVGSWSSLARTVGPTENLTTGTGEIYSDDTENTFISANDRVVAAIGLKDTIIIETKDAVLVTSTKKDQQVKQMVERLKQLNRSEADYHDYVLRPWGRFHNLDRGKGFQVKRLIIKPGASISLQRHHHRSEHWVVVAGEGWVVKDDEEFLLKKNESTYIPMKAVHKLENRGTVDLVVVEVQTGDILDEEDIERFEDIYGRK